MSDVKNGALPDPAAPPPGHSETPAAMPEQSEQERIAQLVVALEAERTELKDKVLRTLADMENLRRRTEKEVADARAYGVTNFARDMLNTADNLRRAVEAIPAEMREKAEDAFRTFINGVELTERDLLTTLARHGVKKLEPLGEKFDPNLHNAIFEVPDATVAKGTVLQVVQTGFVIADRVLRPAMVGVSTGGPKEDTKAGKTVDKAV
jgi:molecular chaperone GrpE